MLFTARCYAQRGLCCHKMSVHLSVTRWYSIQMAKHIIKLFTLSGIVAILVFLYQTIWQYFGGDPLTGASNARYYEKITIFGQYLSLSRNWYKIESYSYNDRLIGSRMWSIEWCHFQWPWMTPNLHFEVIIWHEIFNDTKHRVVSLWQMSCLSVSKYCSVRNHPWFCDYLTIMIIIINTNQVTVATAKGNRPDVQGKR